MKRGVYCSDISNIKRFTTGIENLNNRGAEENSWLLVEGDVGFGKTKALQWYSIQNDTGLLRAKTKWSVAWMLKDICEVLDIQHQHSSRLMFDQICVEIIQRSEFKPYVLIIDEIEHAARKLSVIETIRDLTDSAQFHLIVAGMKGARQHFKRHRQIYRRITDTVDFRAATIEDTHILCSQLSDVKMAPELINAVHRSTSGRHDNILDTIAKIERATGRNRHRIINVSDIPELAKYKTSPAASTDVPRIRKAI